MKKIWIFLFCLCACQLNTVSEAVPEESNTDEVVMACDVDCTDTDPVLHSYDFLIPIDFETFLQDMEEKKDGLYYFGFEDCPWCIQFLPVLDEVVDDEKIYYIKTRDENHELLYTQDQKNAAIPILEQAMSENEEGELTLYVPLLIAVENGEVVAYHQGTLEDHDARSEQLTQEQTDLLKSQLEQILSVFKNNA